MRVAPRFSHRAPFRPPAGAAHMLCTLLLAWLAAGVLPVPTSAAGPIFSRPRREGDILRIFDNATVYIVTNDDANLGDALLRDCRQKQRRILTLDEWRALPEGTLWYTSVVFLINRERLPAGQQIPEDCPADGDELWTGVVRVGRSWGIAYNVTISAPDAAWLRRAVDDFRALKEQPRQPWRRNVRSIAIVPIGKTAALAADALAPPPPGRKEIPTVLAHRLPADRYEASAPRIAAMDEILLVDRSTAGATGGLPASIAALLAARKAGPQETMVWRERKEKGRSRVVFSAPTGALLAEAIRRFPDPSLVPETATVVASARDLRGVRRIAVAGIQNGIGGPDLAGRLANLAATQVRTLDAFEVLERAGLSEVLAEIALGQAGITEARDRDRVRKLAAADALLIVEVTDVRGSTDYDVTQERLTPRLSGPPKRPLEPSRLRYSVAIPGRENDPLLRVVTDGLLRRVVGVKSSREYKDALNEYNNETLPRWQQAADDYEAQMRRRRVTWKQSVMARGTVLLTGSLRLVDLADGLVLWEAPFQATESAEGVFDTRTTTSVGEDGSPAAPACPKASPFPPDELVARAGETGLSQAVQTLRGTALLPTTALLADAAPAQPAPSAVSVTAGRILDLDGDTVLIGLGASDGVKVGDALVVALGENRTARVVVTRVRPRTCDAILEKAATGAPRAALVIGQSASPESAK